MVEHPPAPGPTLTPNFLAIEEALGTVTFPIGRRDLLDLLGAKDEDLVPTALLHGRNVDLLDVVASIPQDWFETEDDFRSALEQRYGLDDADPDPEPLPSGPATSWQADAGPGVTGDADELTEPPDGV